MVHPQPNEDSGAYLDRLLRQGQVKLEITGGTQTWRLLPSLRHQKLIDRIRSSIGPTAGASSCGCYHISDASLAFPDGSLKRPDIAIFCREPPDIDEAWEAVPAAVIEIVSPTYAAKDLSINPPWHLAQGVQDVLVVEPRAERIHHFRPQQQPPVTLPMPQTIDLACGCRVTI